MNTFEAVSLEDKVQLTVKFITEHNNRFNTSSSDELRNEISTLTWEQLWGSTSGPFGGIGGAAMTTFKHDAIIINNSVAALFVKDRLIAVLDFSIRGAKTLVESQRMPFIRDLGIYCQDWGRPESVSQWALKNKENDV